VTWAWCIWPRFPTGETSENPRLYRKGVQQLKVLHQAKDRKKQGSRRRKRAALALAKAQRKVRNQRKDFQQKAAHSLVNRFGLIVFEDLQIINMSQAPRPLPDPDKAGASLPNGASAKAGLNTSILDALWGHFQQFCVAKAESAGRRVLFVDPYTTSQRLPRLWSNRSQGTRRALAFLRVRHRARP
jgi:putative transposase